MTCKELERIRRLLQIPDTEARKLIAQIEKQDAALLESIQRLEKNPYSHNYLCNDKGEHRMACPSNQDKCDCGFDEFLTKAKQARL